MMPYDYVNRLNQLYKYDKEKSEMNGKGYSLYPYQYHIPWVHATKIHSNDE